MEVFQSWLSDSCNNSILSKYPSLSSSPATSTSQETHGTPTLCEDTSFNSLESGYSHNNNYEYPIQNPPLSHFCIGFLKTVTPQICCLAVQNTTLYAATIKEINVFDLITFSRVDTFGSGSGMVKSITFSGKNIFTAHQDCKIRVWQRVIKKSLNKHKHQLISTLPTFKDRLSKCLLAKNYVQIRRHKQKLWIEHADAVSGLAINSDVGLMYSVSWDKSLKIWQLSSDYNIRCLESIKAHTDAVNAVAVNPVDMTIYTGSADGHIKAWRSSSDNRKKHKLLTTLAKHDSSVNALALNKDRSVLFSGGGDKLILVWEKVENEKDYEMYVSCCLKGHEGAILCLVHVNGVLISGSSDRTVRIWKYGKRFAGVCLGVLRGHCKPVKSLVAVCYGDLDDSMSVLSGSLDGEIRAWKVLISDDSD
ncbi:G protein beta subunit-like protein [Handroanthus impetiginosus]|uniref:G protein beta subunit-like protein n=1 Tax=Handroanthus impetiginosus TaxID=429701 RepID=A0A2G9HZZ3_9LAMI|nr:G protein beta subunit-like protein [Handroanthus impetiginosus]